MVFRYGGEEFLVLLPETDLQGAASLAEKIRESALARHFGDGAHIFKLTLSAGAANLRDDESGNDMIARADLALYHAKELGRNRVESAPYAEAAARQDISPTTANSHSIFLINNASLELLDDISQTYLKQKSYLIFRERESLKPHVFSTLSLITLIALLLSGNRSLRLRAAISGRKVTATGTHRI